MKWVKWSINDIPGSARDLKGQCESKFENILITDINNYEDGQCSFSSVETCQYKHDIPNAAFEDILVFGDVELFNLASLITKYELQKDRHPLAQLYNICGADIFRELNGEFTFVLYDRKANKVFLVVDSLGVKDLFWNFSDNILNAGTDLFIIDDLNTKKGWNKRYFRDFLRLNGICVGRETPFIDVFRVLPGYYVMIDLSCADVQEVKYWDLCGVTYQTHYKTENEYFEQFRFLVSQAVERRLLTEQNGIAMSGGLDSTSLFAISKHLDEEVDITPISGVFVNFRDCDETSFIEKVCEMYNTVPTLVNCDDCGMFANFPQQYPVSDEPHCPSLSSSFTQKILEYASRNKITNFIDGYGADFLLSGTPLISVDLWNQKKRLHFIKHIMDISRMFDESIYLSIKKSFVKRNYEDIDDTMLSHIEHTLSNIKTYNQKHIYTQMFYARTYKLLDKVLAPICNISMRHPFLDRDLIEYIYTIPGELLIQSASSKYLLRESMRNYLPQEVVNKSQKTQHVSMSFKGINEAWGILHSILSEYKQNHFCDPCASKDDWLKMLQDFRSGKKFDSAIFSMLCLEIWLSQKFVDHDTQGH